MEAIAAMIVVVRMEEIAVSVGATEVIVEIVVSVRKETDRVVETGVLVHRARTGHRVRKETDRREIVRRVRKESVWSVGRVRKETDHREIARHVRHVHRGIVRRVRKESAWSVGRVLKRLLQPRWHQWTQPLQPRRRHRLHQRLTPLRASSRGRVKPCYWHHHVQSIAASIAVA
jgi:uncharacterized coiled-coil DUF342 family protein